MLLFRWTNVVKAYFFLLLTLLTLSFPQRIEASPLTPIYQNNNIEGGITFTGNTLGLDGSPVSSATKRCPGVFGSFGAFITTESPLPARVCTFPNYLTGLPRPAGTTLTYLDNSSSAYLDIPAGSTVVYAELIWGGSYGFNQLPLGNVDNFPVTLQYGTGTVNSITHNPSTAQNVAYNPSGGPNGGFYVRSQTVTSIIQANGAGYYTVGSVPGTTAAQPEGTDSAGWVLAVAYQNPSMYAKSLSLWVDLAFVDQTTPMTPLHLTGFITPPSGSVSGLLYSAAFEGDTQNTGDQLLFGNTNPPTIAQSGVNNPISNFFASQINTLYNYTTDGAGKLILSAPMLDTRGSYGVGFNGNPFTGVSVSGQRQGLDITAIDISSSLTNNQTSAFIKGSSTFDLYVMFAQGLAIQVNAPTISFTKTVNGGSNATVAGGATVTFDFTLNNVGSQNATNVIFTDDLSVGGFTYVPGTFFINGVLQPDPNLNTGALLPNLLAGGAAVTVEFQATAPLPDGTYNNTGNVSYDYTGSSGTVTGSSASNNVQVFVETILVPPVANDDFGTTSAQVTFNSPTSVLSNDTGNGILVTSFNAVGTAGGTITMDTTTNPLTNGFFVYTPPLNFSGNDTFDYTITDVNSATATATVHMTVLPQAVSDNVYSVAANTPLVNATPSVLANDLGTNLSIVTYDTTTSQGGTISMIVVGINAGQFTYTPPTGFSGIDSFNYTIEDSPNLNQSSATVIIVVFPVAQNDTGTTPANTPLNGTTTFIGSGATVTSWQNPSTQGGTVVFTDVNTGAYTYTPPLNYSGLDTFTYTVTDSGGQTTTGTVTITVVPVTTNDTGTTYANVALPAPTSVLANDIGTTLSINTFTATSVAGGSVVMPSNGFYTYTPPLNFSGQDHFNYTVIGKDSITSDLAFPARVNITVLPVANDSTATTPGQTPLNSTVTFVGSGVFVSSPAAPTPTTQGGTVTFTNPSTGAYTYVPPTGFSGTDTFTFIVQDSSGGVSNPATVTITVTPVAGNYTFGVIENTVFNGPSVFTNSIASNPVVIAPTSGSTAQGGTFVFNPTTGTFVYTPPVNFIGTDSFSYTIQDSSGQNSTGTITLNVGTIEPPTNFIGCIQTTKFFNTTDYVLNAKWTASSSSNITAYRIYLNGKLVAVIPAGAPLVYKVCLKNKKQASQYEITAVDTNGTESAPLKIAITGNC